MKFILFNGEEDYIGNIKFVISATHPEVLNGEDILEMTTLDNRIEKGFRIVYQDIYGHWHEFVVRGVEEIHNKDGKVIHVYCESSFYETIGDYVDDKRPKNATASVALTSALSETRWEVGIVDNLGINSTNFYHISAKEAVQNIVEVWDAELRTRVVISGKKITNRYVDLLQDRGKDLGKRFVYSKDIEEIRKIVHRDDVITALYGYGKGESLDTGGYGRRITFKELNNGKAYVEDLDALAIWGRPTKSGGKSHVFGKIEFDDVEDPQELLALTTEKLQELKNPLITYEADVIDLKAYGFEHEGVELGDTVAVIDREFTPELRMKAKIIEIDRDLLDSANNKIVMGNFRPDLLDDSINTKEFINNFRGKSGVWDRSNVINPDGSINANILNDLIDELNDRLNSVGGYVYISEDGKGISTYDKPIDQNPTKAIQILGGAFRIANSKLPNGEWDWRTFGTGDGFVADLINTGSLNAALIKAGVLSSVDGTTWINMETGEFNFKDALKWVNGVLEINAPDLATKEDIEDNRVYIQYSEDNINWHDIYVDGDIYMRQKVGSGEWSDGMLIKGSDGKDGEAGKDARIVKIIPSHNSFISKSKEVPIPAESYLPENIVLTPIFQNCEFLRWAFYYNTFDSWVTITDGMPGLIVDTATKALTVNNIVNIERFRVISKTGEYDIITIPRVYDSITLVEELEDTIRQNFNYNNVFFSLQDGIVVRDNLSNIVVNIGGIDIDGDNVKDAFGFKIPHVDGTFTAATKDGFMKKWLYGQSEYLKDIYIAEYTREGLTTQYMNDVVDYIPMTIPLPQRWRGRLKETIQAFLVPVNLFFWGSQFNSRGDVIYYNEMSTTILEVVDYHLDGPVPFLDIDAVQYARMDGPGRVIEYDISELKFLVVVIGY